MSQTAGKRKANFYPRTFIKARRSAFKHLDLGPSQSLKQWKWKFTCIGHRMMAPASLWTSKCFHWMEVGCISEKQCFFIVLSSCIWKLILPKILIGIIFFQYRPNIVESPQRVVKQECVPIQNDNVPAVTPLPQKLPPFSGFNNFAALRSLEVPNIMQQRQIFNNLNQPSGSSFGHESSINWSNHNPSTGRNYQADLSNMQTIQQLAPANDSNEIPMLNSGLMQYYMNGMEANVEESIAKLSGEIRDMSFWRIKCAIFTWFLFILF